MSYPKNRVTIEIDSKLAEEIEKILPKTHYESLSEFTEAAAAKFLEEMTMWIKNYSEPYRRKKGLIT